MNNTLFLSRRVVVTMLGASVFAAGYAHDLFAAGPSDPLPSGSKVLRQGSVLVTANGQAANISVPKPATLTVDYNVEAGKELKMIVITDAQFQQISAGRKITGEPVHGSLVSGVDSTAIALSRGSFVLFFGIYQSGNTQLTYRAHYRYS